MFWSFCPLRHTWNSWLTSPWVWSTSVVATSCTEIWQLATACELRLQTFVLWVLKLSCGLIFIFFFFSWRLTMNTSDYIFCLFVCVLQATRRYDGLCCRLWAIQEDLQWRLLQAGQDRQNACEMDCSGESGWQSLYCKERRGKTKNSLEIHTYKPKIWSYFPLNENIQYVSDQHVRQGTVK